jgi:alpha-L-arabinofuranosidase
MDSNREGVPMMIAQTSGARGYALAGLVVASLALLPACPTKDPTDESSTKPETPGAAPPGIGDPMADTSPVGTVAPGPTDPPKPLPCKPPLQSPGAAPDVRVTVRADRGPKGATQPVIVDRRIVGMNIADWRTQDYVPAPSMAFSTYLAALEPGVLRWPAGHRSQEYIWERGGPGQSGNWVLKPAQVDAFIALARSVGADPLIGINVKRGTVAAAADLVRYLNVDHAYNVKWFQIVNEPDLTDGITPGPEVYAEQLVAFADGMRAVDPTIHVVAPELLTGAHVGGFNGKLDWMTPILTRAGARIDGISWHYYPLDSAQADPRSSATLTIPHLFQETASDWQPAGLSFVDEIMPRLTALRKAHSPTANVWITEIAEDPGPTAGATVSDTMAAAIWVADVLGRYAEHGPAAVLRWLYKGDAVHVYGLIDPNDKPRPTYGAYWLYARHLGLRFVDSESSAVTSVSAHASLRGDGALTVVLANKTEKPQRVHLSLEAFGACAGNEITLTGERLTSTTFQINDETLNTTNAQGKIAPRPLTPTSLYDVELPPASVRVVAYTR